MQLLINLGGYFSILLFKDYSREDKGDILLLFFYNDRICGSISKEETLEEEKLGDWLIDLCSPSKISYLFFLMGEETFTDGKRGG